MAFEDVEPIILWNLRQQKRLGFDVTISHTLAFLLDVPRDEVPARLHKSLTAYRRLNTTGRENAIRTAIEKEKKVKR